MGVCVLGLSGKLYGHGEIRFGEHVANLKSHCPRRAGYSLNALVDFPLDNPIEIIKHLIIGSEGTLGFVSRVTYNTVPEWPHKASAFIVFPDVRAACT